MIGSYKDANWRTYHVWVSMKQRCYNSNSKAYRHYGGRGISVCSRWLESFDNFVEDMGYVPGKPREFTLDRIDNNGNYEPSNCRWTSYKEQVSNRGNTVKVGLCTVADLVEISGLKYNTVMKRIGRGMPIHKALTTRLYDSSLYT